MAIIFKRLSWQTARAGLLFDHLGRMQEILLKQRSFEGINMKSCIQICRISNKIHSKTQHFSAEPCFQCSLSPKNIITKSAIISLRKQPKLGTNVTSEFSYNNLLMIQEQRSRRVEVNDMICFNPQCIDSQRQLFNSASENYLHAAHLDKKVCLQLRLANLEELVRFQNQMLEAIILNLLGESKKIGDGNMVTNTAAFIQNVYTNFKSQTELLTEHLLNQMKRVKKHQMLPLLNGLFYRASSQVKPTLIKAVVTACPRIVQKIKQANSQLNMPAKRITQSYLRYLEATNNTQNSLDKNLENMLRNEQLPIKKQKMQVQGGQTSKNLASKISPGSQGVTSEDEALDCLRKEKKIRKEEKTYNPIKRKKLGIFQTQEETIQRQTNLKQIPLEPIQRQKQRSQIQEESSYSKKESSSGLRDTKECTPESIKDASVSIPHQVDLVQESLQAIEEGNSDAIDSQQIPEYETKLRYPLLQIKSEEDVSIVMAPAHDYEANRLIVYHPIKQEALIRVVNKLKPREIVINCLIELDPTIFYQFSPLVWEDLEVFEENWDYNNHFQEKFKAQTFPTAFQGSVGTKKLSFCVHYWAKLKKLKNIWLTNKCDYYELKRSNLRRQKIQSLRIQYTGNTKTDQNFYQLSFLYFQNVTTLKTLIIKDCHISFPSASQRAIKEFIVNNKSIECLYLQNNPIIACYQFLSGLKLKKLAIINQCIPNGELDLTPILNLATLESLCLKKMRVKPCKKPFGFTKLQSLKFLQLNNCDLSLLIPPQERWFHDQAYEQLQYLDFAENFLPSLQFAKQLGNFKKLEHLVLDSTDFDFGYFSGMEFAAFKCLQTIKYLSLNNFCFKHKVKTSYQPMTDSVFQRIAKIFSNLRHINIVGSYKVIRPRYFRQLKWLTHTCVDQRYMTPEFLWEMHKRNISVQMKQDIICT